MVKLVLALAVGAFVPAISQGAESDLEDPTILGGEAYCGRCHTDIYQQWNASTHHFSSFNNPVYRKVFTLVEEKNGPDITEFCSGCHDPVLKSTGRHKSPDKTSWEANAGITCLSCHRVKHSTSANGDFEIKEPLLHPIEIAESPLMSKLHEIGIELIPLLHASTVSDAYYGTSEFCSTCHTLQVKASINGTTDMSFSNEYSQLHSALRSTAHNTQLQCQSCHMQEVESADPAAKDGFIKSHNFAAANNFLPRLNRDIEQYEAVETFLAQDRIAVRLAGIKTGKEALFAPFLEQTFAHSDEIDLAVHVVNQGVGHQFPTGTVDSNEAWLSIRAIDNNDRIIFEHGVVDESSELPAEVIRFGTRFVDSNGNPTDRRNTTTEAVSVSSDTTIPKGARRTVYIRFRIPKETSFPVKVKIAVNWRKYGPDFIDWVFNGKKVPSVPILPIAKLELQLNDSDSTK